MRVIAPSATTIRPEARRVRTLNLELAGLAAATVVCVCGILLATAAKGARVDEPLLQSTATTGAGSVIRLYALEGPAGRGKRHMPAPDAVKRISVPAT